MIDDKRKKTIKICIITGVILTIIAIASFLMVKYQVEGEKNMPYNLNKIIIISSAATTEDSTGENTAQEDGAQQENYVWDEKVIQTNDIYIYLSKNKNYKEETTIKNVKIENIQILQKAAKGKIQVYMPNSLDDELYKYINEFLVNTSLTYTGGAIDNKKTLEIANQGGAVCLSFANVDLGKYQSNEDTEIEQGASILQKMNLTDEDLKFKVSFDLIIDVGKRAYKGTIVLDLPVDGLVGNKESHTEISNFDNVVFKRYKMK